VKVLSTLIRNLWEMPQSKAALLAAALTAVLTLLAYSNSFSAPFQFDDFHQIVNNPYIRRLANIPMFFVDPSLGSFDVSLRGYRPLTLVSFALDYAVSDGGLWPFHLTNLLLHVINAFLVFLIVRAMPKASAGKGGVNAAALPAALVFALHPIQTGAVTYISGRAALLATMFCLLAFHSFLRYRADGGRLWHVLSCVFFLSGLLSKEMAVCLPGLMLAYDFVFASGRRRWPWYVPFAAALILYLMVRRSLAGYVTAPFLPYGAGAYLMSEAGALLLYLRLLVLPVNQNADYDLPATTALDPKVIVAALFIAAMLYLLYRLRSKDPVLAFFGLWFFIALVPESTLIPIPDIAVEYRLYLPSVGFIAAAVMFADGLFKKRETMKKVLALPLIAMLLILTVNRNAVWATETSLWADVVRKSPYSGRAHGNLGNAHYRAGRYSDAIREFGKATEVDPGGGLGYVMYNNLGLCYYELGMYEEALTEFRRTIGINPDFVEAYCNMGAVLYDTGRFRESEDVLKKAISMNPGFDLAHLNLGLAYRKTFRYKEALTEFETAAALSPRDFEIRYNLAIAYYDMKMSDSAAEQAKVAMSLAADGGQAERAGSLLSALQKGGGS